MLLTKYYVCLCVKDDIILSNTYCLPGHCCEVTIGSNNVENVSVGGGGLSAQ